ncbi:DUF4259 domain-containing protein [Solirubrobacter ginsenosidimutans]|uniref:DUF4259 domain-containing protein n=1 Tax=Solirubrobacter ginsenosidimutans TaxID=490573 RepID=A0A9X3MZ47_9ACTN|nr:DUF4259 domain-containing protein [Solirubrobacter ginsenosidimutans]MDA0165192.1 DUF4259 domain-containing protein [Solirubrobacter ginsenosidimutans]
MGAWGEGVLENDAALDWLGELEEQPQIQTVTFALSDAAGTDDYLAASAGCEALVAAELVAYALGRPPSEPEERLATLADELAGLREHANLAVRAVAIVADADHSELTDLWTEDGPNADWDAVLADLRSRLG